MYEVVSASQTDMLCLWSSHVRGADSESRMIGVEAGELGVQAPLHLRHVCNEDALVMQPMGGPRRRCARVERPSSWPMAETPALLICLFQQSSL